MKMPKKNYKNKEKLIVLCQFSLLKGVLKLLLIFKARNWQRHRRDLKIKAKCIYKDIWYDALTKELSYKAIIKIKNNKKWHIKGNLWKCMIHESACKKNKIQGEIKIESLKPCGLKMEKQSNLVT